MGEKVTKRFNTRGPCIPGLHYMLPPLERLPELEDLIANNEYFVLHAPRQSGKTTAMKACAGRINMNPDSPFHALYLSLETLDGIGDLDMGMEGVVSQIHNALYFSEVEALKDALKALPSFSRPGRAPHADSGPDSFLHPPLDISFAAGDTLNALCESLEKKLVVLFDEADCLCGQVAVLFLRQLREGFNNRSETIFPGSVGLIGMRDIRDYRIQDGLYNIAVSFTVPDFTPAQTASLYSQHTEATGQAFEEGAVERAMFWSGGQPWLVNALADEATARQLKGDVAAPVTADVIDRAAEAVKLARETHIDYLLAHLPVHPVKRVMEAVLSGSKLAPGSRDGDLKFCLELGLVKASDCRPATPANHIYADSVVGALTEVFKMNLPYDLMNPPDDLKGRFSLFSPDISGLLRSFQKFWADNDGDMSDQFTYKECDAQLSLIGYMEKCLGGSVRLEKYFASGSGRVDLRAVHRGRKYPVQVKLKSTGWYTEADAVKHLAGCMETCLAYEGWLVVFDRESRKPWKKRLTWKTLDLPEGRKVHVVGC